MSFSWPQLVKMELHLQNRRTVKMGFGGGEAFFNRGHIGFEMTRGIQVEKKTKSWRNTDQNANLAMFNSMTRFKKNT